MCFDFNSNTTKSPVEYNYETIHSLSIYLDHQGRAEELEHDRSVLAGCLLSPQAPTLPQGLPVRLRGGVLRVRGSELWVRGLRVFGSRSGQVRSGSGKSEGRVVGSGTKVRGWTMCARV